MGGCISLRNASRLHQFCLICCSLLAAVINLFFFFACSTANRLLLDTLFRDNDAAWPAGSFSSFLVTFSAVLKNHRRDLPVD